VSFIAEASREADAPPERVFDRLADFGSWHEWMPKTFRPVGREPAILSAGARIKTRIGRGVLAKLEVTVCERPREITWCGGLPGVLRAEHRFLFEPTSDGKKTRIRSVETWRGALTPFLRPIVKRLAEKIGQQQVDAIAKAAAR
jgi:hypothetical protein